MLWRRKPQHHKVRDGGFPCHNHKQLPISEVDGLVYQDSDGMRQECNEIRNRDIPCHIPQIPTLSSFRQMDDYVLREATL